MSGEPVQPDDDPLTPPPHEGRFARLIRRTEEWFFVAILLALVGVGLAPIIARRFDLGSITWSVDVSRQLVLWIALFGAGAATRDRKHIVIDAVSHLLSVRNKFRLSALTGLISTAACGFLFVLCVRFVQSELEFNSDVSWHFGIPLWILSVVLPVGFLILTLRFMASTYEDIISGFVRRQPKDQEEPAA